MSIALFSVPFSCYPDYSELITHCCRLCVNGDTSLLNLGAEERDPWLQTTQQMNLRMT